MSFRRVIDILDEAIGGPQVGIGAHRAFWRGLTREEFVAKKVFGKALVILGDGANSNLVLALKGQAPFGADLSDPPAGATISRMPAGLSPVPADSIAFIEGWINDGCPDETPPAQPFWRVTNAPEASSRTDDIWFLDHNRGWAVNSNGQILHTADGFSTWTEQFHDEELYLRCVGFASESRGWVGTLTASNRLLETHDGGANWTAVTDLPDLAPSAVCGLAVVNESVVYASGTNFPNRPARMMRTVDGGATWQAWEMSAHADLLVDTYFTDPDNGWVVGGLATVPNPTRDDVRAVVLRTTDGGRTWTDKAAPLDEQLPLGEWGWKIHFVTEQLGYVALESFTRAAILKTVDGGESWIRIDVNDPQGNANLEGIGFLDETVGWVGGWGSASFTEGFSSATVDGGETWQDANQIGRFLNRFRFFRDIPIGYASGLTIYKYSDEPLPAPELAATSARGLRRLLADKMPLAGGRPLQITATVPDGTDHLRVSIWDRFGEQVRRLVDENQPRTGTRTLEWDGVGDDGEPVPEGAMIVRITVDGYSESQITHLAPQ